MIFSPAVPRLSSNRWGAHRSGAVVTTPKLSDRERDLLSTLRAIKAESGSHSPSLSTLLDRIPDLDIKVDACFLSNPYATDLFIDRLTSDLLETGELRRVL